MATTRPPRPSLPYLEVPGVQRSTRREDVAQAQAVPVARVRTEPQLPAWSPEELSAIEQIVELALERKHTQSQGDVFRAATTMIESKVRVRTRRQRQREIAAWVGFAIMLGGWATIEVVRLARRVEAELDTPPPIAIPVEVPVPSQDAAELAAIRAELERLARHHDERVEVEPEPEPEPKRKPRKGTR